MKQRLVRSQRARLMEPRIPIAAAGASNDQPESRGESIIRNKPTCPRPLIHHTSITDGKLVWSETSRLR